MKERSGRRIKEEPRASRGQGGGAARLVEDAGRVVERGVELEDDAVDERGQILVVGPAHVDVPARRWKEKVGECRGEKNGLLLSRRDLCGKGRSRADSKLGEEFVNSGFGETRISPMETISSL
jgi:hypothetical protein